MRRCMICGAESTQGFCEAHRDPATHTPTPREHRRVKPAEGLLGHVKSRQGTGDGIRAEPGELPASFSRAPCFDGEEVVRYGHKVLEVERGLFATADNGAPIIANETDRKRWDDYDRRRGA